MDHEAASKSSSSACSNDTGLARNSTRRQIFLLSPAHCGGRRAALLFNDAAGFELARRIRAPGGVPIGTVFSFLSGLYFRGKLQYANRFKRPPARIHGALIITTNRGLVPVETKINLADLKTLGCVDIDHRNPLYAEPLRRDAGLVAASAADTDVVLLGSVATGKYVDVLSNVFGPRLLFPREFAGRGDMSRGGLLLRCVAEDRELTYVPVVGGQRRGKRPPRLSPKIHAPDFS